jgi:hypothetical protein
MAASSCARLTYTLICLHHVVHCNIQVCMLTSHYALLTATLTVCIPGSSVVYCRIYLYFWSQMNTFLTKTVMRHLLFYEQVSSASHAKTFIKISHKYRVILSALYPRKCEYLNDYSFDFEHEYMTTYLAS